MVHRLNASGHFDGSVLVVPPRPSDKAARLNAQDGLFTFIQRGLVNHEIVEEIEIVRSIRRALDPAKDYAALLACARQPELRYIVSNTTEAGIACHPDDRFDAEPPVSFPGKLTRFLVERHRAFGDTPASEMIILPCELIESNGHALRACVRETAARWQLPPDFLAWLDARILFCNTLVDRIVTGFPADEADALAERLGYTDALLNTGEPFHAWIIEGPAHLADELPFAHAGLNVTFTPDVRPYRERKVRILNGAHTLIALAAFPAGHVTVKQTLDDPRFAAFLRRTLHDEILPTLDLPRADLEAFAAATLERFANPFVHHALLSISLNSTSKFTARLLPSLERHAAPPPGLTFALAALLAFTRGTELRDGALLGHRADGSTYPIRDTPEALAFLQSLWSAADTSPETLTRAALAHAPLWGGRDLSLLPGLVPAVSARLAAIQLRGIIPSLETLFSNSPSH